MTQSLRRPWNFYREKHLKRLQLSGVSLHFNYLLRWLALAPPDPTTPTSAPKLHPKEKKRLKKKQTHNFFAYERKRNCLTAIFTLRCTNGNFLFRKWINAGITLGNVFDGDFFFLGLSTLLLCKWEASLRIFSIFSLMEQEDSRAPGSALYLVYK